MTTEGSMPPDSVEEGEPFRLLPTVNALLRRRWTVMGWTLGAAGIAAVSVLIASPVWTATAKFLPSKASGVSSRMTAIAGGPAAAAPEDDAGSSDYYVTLVQSPGFLSKIVERPLAATGAPPRTLVEHYGLDAGDNAIRVRRAAALLQGQISITAARAAAPGSPRVVTMQVLADAPDLAAELAQAVLDQINVHNSMTRENRAERNRVFVEEQVVKAKRELDDATDALATFEVRNRRAEAPRLRAEQERLSRQVRVLEEVYVTLTKQLELSKVEEEESRPSIEVIQQPEPPLSRTSPRRTQTVVVATVIGFFIGCIWALASERFRRSDPDDPEAAEFRRQLDGIRREALAVVGRSSKDGDDRR